MAKKRSKSQQAELPLEHIEHEPKGQARFEREADELIAAEMKRRRRVFQWTNEGEAFAHLFAQYCLDLDEDEAARAAEVGRAGHDKGIDAYYLDEDPNAGTGTFYILQAKSTHKTYDENVLYDDVRRAIEYLNSGDTEGAKPTLLEALQEFREAVRNRYDIIFALGLNGRADKVRQVVPSFESNLPISCEIQVFDGDDIRALVMRSQVIPHRGPDATFNLLQSCWEVKLSDKLPKMVVAAVQARELAKLVRDNRLAVFSLNVREYLGSKNPVNKVISDSLRDSPEWFYYLNLGIDAVCDKCEPVQMVDLLGENRWSLKIKGFQIVNGCQTAKTIADADSNSGALVMVRIIEVERRQREQLVPDISVAKNRQSPIQGRDLFAWDENQTRLKREFQKLGVFFEAREKEWEALTRHKPEVRKIFSKGRLDNVTAAKAYLSVFLQDPFRAKHRKKEFFQHEGEGGAFERIFTDTPAEQMLLATHVYQFVSDKGKEAGQQFRRLAKLADERSLSEEEKYELEEANVIWNGDTYLSSLVGYFFGRYYGQTLMDDKSLDLTRHLLKQIPSLESAKAQQSLEPVYDLAREIVVQTYGIVRDNQPTKELYSPRRFFYQEDTYGVLKKQAHAKSLHILSKVLQPLKS